jgi:hypothetical protein
MPMNVRKILTSAAVSTAVLGGVLFNLSSGSKHPGEPAFASTTAPKSVLDLIDRALSGPAGIEDEGAYNLIDPIGPGASTSVSAADEVYSSTLVVGKYTPWQAYRDPFAAAPGTTPPPGPYTPPGPPHRRGGDK